LPTARACFDQPYPRSCCSNKGGNDVADVRGKPEERNDESVTDSATVDSRKYVAKHRADRKKEVHEAAPKS
jgi:hypothetical protein